MWETLRKVVAQVEDLQGENEKLGQIIKEYSNKFGGKLDEYKDVIEVDAHVTEMRDELINLKKKASEKLVIEFVGATSSGKSSLINCLLREDRLPVDMLQCTMCSIHVRTTSESKWSVLVNEELLKNGDDKETVTKLLNAMSDSAAKEKREILGITKESVVEVLWPKHLCTRLPDNVVLVDTPGYVENPISTKVVTDSSKKADIIVAVMRIDVPTPEALSQLVKKVNCQYTFGVYTRWDKCIKKKKEADGRATVEDVRKTHEEKYRSMIATDEEDKDQVFFVNVKSVQEIKKAEEADGTDGTNDFFKFEKCLAKSAKVKKEQLLIKQANFAITKSENALSQFEEYVRERVKKTQIELTNVTASLQSGSDDFQKKEPEKYDIFGEHEINTLLKNFETGITNSGRSESEMLEKFCDEVNRKIKEVITHKTVIANNFKEWTDKKQLSKRVRLKWVLPENVPQLKHKELKNGRYYAALDPHVYLTSNFFWGSLVTVSAAGTTLGVVAMMLVRRALIVGTGVAAAAAAAAVRAVVPTRAEVLVEAGASLTNVVRQAFGLGDLIKERWFPISKYRVDTWKESLKEELQKAEDSSRQLISKEINLIYQEISSQLQSAKVEVCEEMGEKEQDCTKCVSELDQRSQALKRIHDSLKRQQNDRDDQTEEQSFPVSTSF